MGFLDSIRNCLGIAERVKIRKHDPVSVIKTLPVRKKPLLNRQFTTEELIFIPIFANRFESFIDYKNRIIFHGNENKKSQLDLFDNLTIVLSEEEQNCILMMLEWHKKPKQFREWLRKQDDRTLAQLAVHYSMGEKAYAKWLESKFPTLYSKIIGVIPASIDETVYVKLQQKHKKTDTVVESISGAGFPIDMGWFLQSISAISVYLDTLAVGITATATIFTLAISFGAIVYFMVSSWIKSEEEETMMAYAKYSRQIDVKNEQMMRDKDKALLLCNLIMKEVSGTPTASSENVTSITLDEKLENIKRCFEQVSDTYLKHDIENLSNWISDPFEPRTKPFARSMIIVNPLLVGTTLFGGLFFGLYSSVTSMLTMLGAATVATALTGGTVMVIIGVSMLLIACYFAWGNYESMQSLAERSDTLCEIEEQEYNVKSEAARREHQVKNLQNIHNKILQSKVEFMQGSPEETADLAPTSQLTTSNSDQSQPSAILLARREERRDTYQTQGHEFNQYAWWSHFLTTAKNGEQHRPRRVISAVPTSFSP